MVVAEDSPIAGQGLLVQLVYTPLREGRAAWPEEAFEDDVAELAGVRARVISLPALRADKAERRDDPIVAAKDRADLATLSTLS